MLSSNATSYTREQPRSSGREFDPHGLRRFDLAEGAYSPSPAVLRALRTVRRSSLSGLPDRSALRLRQSIATFLGVTHENITVFAGADEAIDLIPRTYLNPGDVAFVVVPTFPRLIRTNEKVGARVVLHALREDRNFTLDRDEAMAIAEEIARAGARVVWLCSPGNPTGRVIATDVVGLLATQFPGVQFVVDEAYQEYVSLDPRQSAVSLIAKHENIIVLRTFSKALGLASMRVGYAVASERTSTELGALRIAFSTSTVTQVLAIAALSDLGYIDKLATRIREERTRIERVIETHASLAYARGSASNLLLIHHTHADLYAMLAQRGVFSLDLRGSAGLLNANYVRLSIGRPDDNRFLRDVIRSIR